MGRRTRTWPLPLEKALKLLSDKSRLGYLPLDKYDVDIDLTRGFPADVCRRWWAHMKEVIAMMVSAELGTA